MYSLAPTSLASPSLLLPLLFVPLPLLLRDGNAEDAADEVRSDERLDDVLFDVAEGELFFVDWP